MNIYEIWTQTNPHFPFIFHRYAFLPMDYILVSVFCWVRWPLVYLANDWWPKCNSHIRRAVSLQHKAQDQIHLNPEEKRRKLKKCLKIWTYDIQRWFTCRLRRINWIMVSKAKLERTAALMGGAISRSGEDSLYTHRGPADPFKSDSHTRWREGTHQGLWTRLETQRKQRFRKGRG